MHDNCKKIFEDFCLPYFKESSRVIEVGPPLESNWYKKTVRNRKKCQWDTVDIRNDRAPGGKFHDVKFTGTMYQYPIEDNQYDVVLAFMVLEHVPMPWEWIRELKRICKHEGYIMVCAPFIGVQHGNVDCWRVLPQGMEALADSQDLEVVHCATHDAVITDYHRDTLLIARKKASDD